MTDKTQADLRAAPLDPNEADPSVLWAEIIRLQSAVQGPAGYATWQDAATAERIRRVKAERALVAPIQSQEGLRPALQFDLTTSDGGRGFVAWYFSTIIKRQDFANYIASHLAADFACALAAHLRAALSAPIPPQEAPGVQSDEEVADAVSDLLGISPGAWDTIHSGRIVQAFRKVLGAPTGALVPEKRWCDTCQVALSHHSKLACDGCTAPDGTMRNWRSRYLAATPSPATAAAPAEHVPVSPEEARAIDAALGLFELPPIRLGLAVGRKLKEDAAAKGLILQAHVRDLLTYAAAPQPSAPEQALQALTADAEALGLYEQPADERDQFEEWYADDMRVNGFKDVTAAEIREMREGDFYGAHRNNLNGKWEGWQAKGATHATQPSAPVEAVAESMGGRKIETVFVNPPVPTRQWDWVAYFEGEEGGPKGSGPTRDAAVRDLREQWEVRDENSAPACEACAAPGHAPADCPMLRAEPELLAAPTTPQYTYTLAGYKAFGDPVLSDDPAIQRQACCATGHRSAPHHCRIPLWPRSHRRSNERTGMSTTHDLRSAAQAVLDRWDSQGWKWAKQGPTADLMADLRSALAAPAQPEAQAVYAEARECNACNHVGINDSHSTNAACTSCDWSGPSPVEDICPGCGRTGSMSAACPDCGGYYRLLAHTDIGAPQPEAQAVAAADVQEAVNTIMEQAQVFASAWSLVGGRFDSGNGLADAEDAKLELRSLVRSLALYAATPQPEPRKALSEAARDVLAERERQVTAEGWTPEHDDEHEHGEMSKAASAYAWGSNYPLILGAGNPPDCWPWDVEWWKPTEPRRDLVKAGALILAEIERMDRAAISHPAAAQVSEAPAGAVDAGGAAVTEIAALFVETDGAYFGLPGVEPWDEARDARNYRGPHPVIAHPPCQRWGALAAVNFKRWGGLHNMPGNDGGTFATALHAVKLWGGVLEHPAKSRAWRHFGLTEPSGVGWQRSADGAWVCEVWQSAYGHRASKATWLYCRAPAKPPELRWDRPAGTHQVGFHDQRGKERNKPTLSRKEASATPVEFRDVLLELARPATPARAAGDAA